MAGLQCRQVLSKIADIDDYVGSVRALVVGHDRYRTDQQANQVTLRRAHTYQLSMRVRRSTGSGVDSGSDCAIQGDICLSVGQGELVTLDRNLGMHFQNIQRCVIAVNDLAFAVEEDASE